MLATTELVYKLTVDKVAWLGLDPEHIRRSV